MRKTEARTRPTFTAYGVIEAKEGRPHGVFMAMVESAILLSVKVRPRSLWRFPKTIEF